VTKGRERRIHPRYEVENVQGVLSFSVQAKVLNLSLTGVAIETTSALRIGKAYTFRFGHGARALTVSGKVQWSFLRRTEKTLTGEVRPIYETGIAFEGVLSEAGDDLRHFLQETAILDTENRLCARFRLDATEPTEVSTDHVFSVPQISLSGMLVSADFSLPVDRVFEAEIQLNGDRVRTRARIVHAREVAGGPEPRFLMGVEFLDMDPDERRVLQDFIRRELERREAETG
jgi:hypothetical protein